MATDRPSPARRDVAWVLPSLLAITLLAGQAYLLRGWMLDDAFISFRYAENLAAGEGLVYNAGERVEGYTTFLWVVLLAGLHALGVDTVLAARVAGLTLAGACLILLSFAHRFVAGMTRRDSAVATILLGSSAAFTTWGASGMEVALTGFLLVMAVLLHDHAQGVEQGGLATTASGLCFGLAAMSRPDAALVFMVFFAARVIDRSRIDRTGWFRFGAAFAVLYVPYFVWRFLYYGWLLPNTFYAKVGARADQLIRGGIYFTDWAGAALLVLAPALIGPFLATRTTRRRPLGPLPAALALHAIYVVSVGGDSQPAFRFFATVMPLLCLYSGLIIGDLVPAAGRAAAVVGAIVAFNLFQLHHHPQLNRLVLVDRVARDGAEVGRWLREHAAPEAVVATNTAGTVPYYARLRAIDMLGLTDETIAHRHIPTLGSGIAGHEKGDGSYVLSREPDYILLGSATGSGKPRRLGDHEIVADPRLQAHYVFRRYRLRGGKRLRLFERR